MPVAAVGGATAIYGASQNRAASRDANKQAQKGLDWTKQVYGDAQGNLGGYISAGQGAGGLAGWNALNQGDYSGFDHSPDYLWAKQQSMSDIQHSAAAHGSLYAGGTLKDLVQFNQGLATQTLGNYRNSLSSLAQMGQNAASTLGGIGTQTSQMVNGAYGNIAQANQGRYDSNAQLGGALGGLFGQWYNSRPGSSSAYSGSSYAPLGSAGSGNNPFMTGNWTMGGGFS